MAFQTPSHRKRFVLVNRFHLVNTAMAGYAADALVHMGGMIKKHKVGLIMHLDPRYRLAGRVAFAYQLELLAFRLDTCVAIHTDFCGRDCRVGRLLDG